jgi:hypothetical protein
VRKIPTIQSLFQRKTHRKRLRSRSVFRKLLGIETLESRALLASDAIQINSLSDLATYYDAGTNSYSIGEESTSSVTIADGIVIDTSSALGQAGSITIQGDEITIGNNVQITANGPLNTATGLEQDGAIKLLSENVLTGFNNSAVMQIEDLVRAFQGQKSTITVGTSTVIEGGAITISTDSGNELWGDFIASQVHLASKVFLEAIQKPDPLALPITVQVWEPVSEITIGKGTSIQSSSEVSLSATATANAFGKAVWNTLSEKTGKSPLGFALGEFVNIAKANIDVSSNATISAEGDIEINTKVDNVTELEVATIENLGITQTNPKANSFAYGSTEVISKSTILLDVGSQVVSSDGNVTIEAEATDENSVSSKATSYRDGFVAIGGAFAYSKATVTVDVKGTVTSGIVETETSSPENLIFNPAFVVDFATNSLVFDEDVPYSTGDQVLFNSPDGSTIPGLVPGTVYYAIVDTTNPKSLQLSLTSAGATTGTEIPWADSYPTLTVGGYPLPITVVDSVYTNTILFSYDTLPDTTTAVFTDGQLVTYSPVTGQFLGANDASGNLLGALPAGLYTIKIATSPQPSLFPLAIQLVDQAGLIGPSGNVVVLNTNSFFTTASGTVVQIASTDLQLSQITLNFSTLSDSQDGQAPLPTPPAQTPTQSALFTNGQPLVFTSGLGNQIGNLTNAASYWAVVDSSTPGVIRLASNYEQSVAANPSVQNFVPELKTVSNQAAVQSVANSFTDVNSVTSYTLQTNNAYSIWNNADGGTFTITLLGPDGAVTTTDLAWNVSSADLQSALNSLSGIVSTVSGQGTQLAPWIVSILFQFEIGTVEPGTGLVFTNDPNIADGTAVIYLGNAAKPIEGLTVGSTYYAYNGTNPSFDTDIPQYVLNLRTTQDTTAPVIQYELVQSMTDSQGNQYNFLSSIASQNLLTLNLPSSVVIEPIDGSALTGGTLTSLTLAANTATTLYSFATSGTFTLIATDAQGITQTTSSLAYNASAIEVETALNALGILPVQVTGLGTMASPWTVVGLTDQTLTADNSLLRSGTFVASILIDELVVDTQQIWTEATGGTFVLNLTAGGQMFTTAAIAWNATASQVSDSIEQAQVINNVPVVRAVVTGTGTEADPWQISMWYQSIQTGDALTFNDSWLLSSLGMVNGQTYYAVVSTSQLTASGVTLSLALSLADATASTPDVIVMQEYLLLTASSTGSMVGSQMGIGLVPKDSGVTIRATLEASDSASMATSIGLFPMLGFYLKSIMGDNEIEDGKWVSGIEKEIEEKLPKEKYDNSPFKLHLKKYHGIENIDGTNPFEISLGFALIVSENVVAVTIDSDAVIESQGSVTIESGIGHVLHSFASAGTARTTASEEAKGNAALGVGLAMTFVDNTSNAIIESNAQVSGATGVSIKSNIEYPFAWKQTEISKVKNGDLEDNYKSKGSAGTQIAENVVINALFANAFGVSNWLFNDSTNVDAMSGDTDESKLDFALSGSLLVKNITNKNVAQIFDGAKINQSTNVLASEAQSLEIVAETTIDQVSMAGQMILGLNLGWLIYASKTKGGLGENSNFLLGLTDAKNNIGGSFNFSDLNNTTQAIIGGTSTASDAAAPSGPTSIDFGNDGLVLESSTNVEFIPLAQSGGISTGFGLEASLVDVNVQKQTTHSAILDATFAPVITADEETTGEIKLTADDQSILTPSAGGLFIGGSVNIGFSSAIAVLNRDVQAFIGQDLTSDTTTPPAQSTWAAIESLGSVIIDASASGKIIPISIAGSVSKKKSEEEGKVVPDDQKDPVHFGFGVSGSYSEANITDTVQAYLNGVVLTNKVNPLEINSLEIQATNSTQTDLATGAAAFQREDGKNSGVGIAGAGSALIYASTVQAIVSSADLTAYELSLNSKNNKDLGTFAAGLDGGSVAAAAIEVAGSVAINHITNVTKSEILNSTGGEIGAISLSALENDDVVSAAGTLTIVTSLGSSSLGQDEGKSKVKVGFGFGFAQNLLDSTTYATISDANLDQTEGAVSIQSEQASRSFVLAAGAVFEVGQGTGIAAYGMVALNEYTTADVQATVAGSTISSSSVASTTDETTVGMSVVSTLVPIMITAAGDLGLGIAYKTGPGATEASIGAGVSVTEVSITGNSLATISDSTITLDQGNLVVDAFTGQATDYSELDDTLTEINLPLGKYNLFSLAIAGGLSGAISAAGEMAFGINGVGAGIGSTTSITTQAGISSDSTIELQDNSAGGGALSITALENLNIYNDAGGASVSFAVTDGDTSVGVAVGIGAAVHTNTNKVIASLEDSTATVMGGLTIDSQSESEVTSIGFGVALDLSVAALTGVSFAASSAVAKMDSTQTISAYLSGGSTAVGDDSADVLNVTASDGSVFYTAVGSGSLAGAASGWASVSLAAGASVSRIEPTHTISAYIGDSTSPTQTTTVMARGPVVVQATNEQVLTADAIAVASSVSFGGAASGSFAAAGASSRITTANSITAGLYAGTVLKSTLQGAAGNAISVQSTDSAKINSTVGSAAAAFSISPIPVGASLGISISEITNNNVSQSLINSATISTAGGDILVQTTGSNNHSSKSVATSLTDGLGVAGAGGNSNIYDYAKFTASVEGATSINTTLVGTESNPTVVGDLSVLANSSETILAEVFGGAADLGIGSVGVFISNAARSGATQANLVTEGLISVGNLNVKATTDQTITSDGMSVTIGLLAGSGETHNLVVNEQVGVSLSGSTATPVTPWSVSGNLTLDANSQNQAVAKTSGAGDGQQGVNIALLGAGSFKVVSEVSPVVGVSVSNVTIAVTGASLMTAVADSQNQANTRSGSGSLVGANAAIAQTVNDPTISLTTSALNLTADSATFQIENDLSYETSTNSIYATLIGGSGATATNNSTPSQTITLGQGTVIATTGSVVLSSVGTMLGAGGGDSSNANGFMANVGGGGGLIGGFGALSTSNMTSTSTITLDDDVSIVASDKGDIQIGAQSDWSINQFTHMSTGSSISGDGIASNIESKLGTAIQIGEGVQLKALEGQVEIGTAIRSLTSADSYSRTFGLAGGVSGNVDNQTTATQSVTVGQDATLTGGEGVTVTAGFNPLLQTGTQNDAYAIVTTRVMGLLDFPTNNYESDLAANNTVNVGSGTNIISGRDVQIGSVPGINSAVAYSFHNIDGGKGKTDTVTDGVTESNVVTLDGTIVAGQDHELAINIQESGNSFTMAINGGSPQAFPVSGDGSLQTVSPTANQTFVPFQVAVNDAYDPAELLVGLDPTVQDVLSLSLSSTPVSAITLQGIKAVGGRVLIQAGSLNGTGTVSAYSPAISLVNQSDAYLLLESLTIPQTYGMGQIDLTGGATLPGTLIFQSFPSAPTVLVSMTGTGPVGNNASGPALGLLGNITNTDGTVSISNSEGAFVQSGTILAESVTIDVPNASYIVNTPAAYFGTSGDIQDYWGNSANLIPDGNFESSQWNSESGSYLYNPTQLGWTFSGAGITGNNSGFTSGNPVAPIGSQVAFVQTKGTITRELAGLIPGSSYQLDLYAAQRAGYSPQTLSLSVGSLNIGTVAPLGSSYQSFSLPFVAPLPETTPVANTSMLTLSTGESDTATAAWNPDLISIPSSGTLTFEFTYQASGNKGADGVAMVFQNQGGYALGQTGGNLGYVGILGDTAAYQINLYNGHVQGSNFVTTNSAGTYLTTGGVNFNSGNPIQVTLVYDADAQTVTESLSDLTTNATFTRTYSGINLASVLGTTATFGFTGGEGSVTSIQTISNFTMTNSTTNSITGFAGWGYVTPLTLTITGLNPGGTDETAFIDGLILSQNATGFTPGLNWYSPYSSTAGAYSANVAASSAANALYGSASNASTSIGFSNYLYNKSQTGISNFTNANVSVGSVGSNYPSSANNNWNTTENGTGVMFFGSQIPYVWSNVTTISGGTQYLTGYNSIPGLGYLDTFTNAQTYSPLASGNPNDSGLNVTQGTGPQNGTNGAQRGVFPMVPYNVNGTVPTQATVASPQTRTLGGSITAGNISVTALYIDINGPINVGPVTTPISVILGSSLQTMITQFQTAFDAGTQLNPELSIDSYLGDSGLTGFYDAQLQQLFLEPYSINAGNVAAVFNGGILSTTSSGKISMISNPNAISIVNQTNIPMVLQGIAASVTAATGIVEFQDTFSNTSTVYVYKANSSEIAIYTGAYGATRDEMTDTGTTPGTTISHALEPNLSYQWTQEAYISRQLSFTNASESYTLNGPTAGNDHWSWGALNSSGTAPTNYGLASNPFASDKLILTDGVTDTAVAVWNQQTVPLSGTFTVQFDYQAGGSKAADGVTFAFQNEGLTAAGGAGGLLGYVGITGATAAYQINIYNGHTIGSNFVTTNTSGSYLTTGNVAFNSGNVIQVKLEFDGTSQTVTENLTDTVTGATFSRTYSNINLANLLGASAYIGFTGGDGGATSIQTVSAFSYTNASPGFAGFLVQGGTSSVVLGQQTGTEYSQSLTAVITQSETAKTTFSSPNNDAWNYGPKSTWTWTYPTEILLQLKNQLPASNPIAIDFSGIKTGSLSVQSTASSLYVNGNIQFPGSVQLVGSQGIFASASGLIEAQSVQFESSSGSIGTSTAPISIGGSTQVNASSSSSSSTSIGVYLSSPSNLLVGSIQSTKGPVVLQTTGNIQGVAGSTTPSVMGTNIQLTASNGSIGTQAAPLVIQTQTSQLDTGTIVDGLLTASALNSIYVLQPSGELRLASVVTTAPLGVVSIVNTTGDITDGLRQDAFGLNDSKLSSDSVSHLVNAIKRQATDSVTTTVDAFEGSVDASYRSYWNIVGNSTNSDGSLELTEQGIELYQTQANAYYALPALNGFAGWEGVGSNASSAKPTSLTLSNGTSNSATAVWNPTELAIPSTGSFELSFVYQTNGSGLDYGITLAFQTQGVGAVGGAGTGLGYVGIGGPTAAYQIYANNQSGNTPGSNFVLTNTSGTYLPTGSVNFSSGNPILVQLVYDAEANTLTETLQDTVSLSTFSRVYSAVDLSSLLGAKAYIGFTGSDGQGTSTQTVAGFALAGVATPAQVQSYVDGLYANAVEVFEGELVFGPDWADLPQFSAYDPAYAFTLSSSAQSQLTEGALTVTNLYALLSLEALSPKGTQQLGSNVEPVISTSVLFLSAGGSIGLYQDPVEIDLGDIQTGNLTAFQKELLARATSAGELQFVGTNAAGSRVVYSYGDEPQGVTPTAVIVKIARALNVDVSASGIAMLEASESINLTETSGSMNVLYATGGKTSPVTLEAQSGLLPVMLQASTSDAGWSRNGTGTLGYTGTSSAWTPTSMTLSSAPSSGISANGLSLTAGGSIGSSEQSLLFNATGSVNVFSLGSVWLQSDSPIQVREWTVNGALNLHVVGPNTTTDALAGTRSSFEGFESDTAGWKAASLNGNTSVATPANGSEVLTLSTNANPNATTPVLGYGQASYTKNASVSFGEKFLIGFLYQSAGVGGRVALNLGNANQTGLALVLNLGGAGGTGEWADFVDTAEIGTASQGQSLGSVDLNSNHPILVVWSYDNISQIATATFTDTVTSQTATISQSGIKWLQQLGSRSAQMSWQALGDGTTNLTHSISEFQLIDGPVNMTSGSLDVVTFGNFGQPNTVDLQQFGNWVNAKTGYGPNNVNNMELTNGNGSQANAFWYPNRLDLVSTGTFIVEFTYTASGAKQADGITFAFQTVGTSALGATGGSLGYTGISGPTAAYQINLYNGSVQGSNFVVNNTTGTYLPTGAVSFHSGDAINVQLVFDLDNNTVTENLTDTAYGTKFTRTYSNIDLSELFEANVYIGFTGGEGGETSIQEVSNFSLTQQTATPILMLINGEVQISANAGIGAEQVLGDVEVGTISSQSLIDLTAPFGAVVSYKAPSNTGSSGDGEPSRVGLVAPAVTITALQGIGVSSKPLEVFADRLSGETRLNDMLIRHDAFSGDTTASILKLIAGGVIQFTSNSHLSVDGQVLAQNALFRSAVANRDLELAIGQLSHSLGGSLPITLGGFANLKINDVANGLGRSIQVAQGLLDTQTSKVTLGDIRQLAMSLGGGDDSVNVQDASGLKSLGIDGNEGADRYSLGRDAWKFPSMNINGQAGVDALLVDLRTLGAWVTADSISTATGTIQHTGIENRNLSNLEDDLGVGSLPSISLLQEDFPANRLLILGTSGADSVALTSQATGWRINTVWNGQTTERRTFASGQISDVQLFTLGGSDFVTILGSASLLLNLQTGRDDDWINVQSGSATITDPHGNNFISTDGGDDTIHTGAGDDEIDAGGGRNKITDDGGLNTIFTGDQNDQIYHANADDTILAAGGINDIWLNGVHQGWSNPRLPMDVDRDGQISPIDVLILINEINKGGSGRMLGSPDSASFYLDPDNDGFLAPLDVLVLVNWLNRSNGGGSGESDSDPATANSVGAGASEQQRNVDAYFAGYEDDTQPESLKRTRRRSAI